ncbi:EamA family transporter [Kitasatospora sp. NPDC001683]
MLGDVILLAAGVAWAACNVVARRTSLGHSPLTSTYYQTVAGALGSVLPSPFEVRDWRMPGAADIGMLAFLALMCSIAAFVLSDAQETGNSPRFMSMRQYTGRGGRTTGGRTECRARPRRSSEWSPVVDPSGPGGVVSPEWAVPNASGRGCFSRSSITADRRASPSTAVSDRGTRDRIGSPGSAKSCTPQED